MRVGRGRGPQEHTSSSGRGGGRHARSAISSYISSYASGCASAGVGSRLVRRPPNAATQTGAGESPPMATPCGSAWCPHGGAGGAGTDGHQTHCVCVCVCVCV